MQHFQAVVLVRDLISACMRFALRFVAQSVVVVFAVQAEQCQQL
jgi:hypothetical protein